jgi:hypothetical protein
MLYAVEWKLTLEVKNLHKCRKVLGRIESAIGQPMLDARVDRLGFYFNGYFLVTGRTVHEAGSPHEATSGIMEARSRLSRSWDGADPIIRGPERLEWESRTDWRRCSIPGLIGARMEALPPETA